MEKKLTVKDKIFAFLEKKGISKTVFYAETGIEASNFKGKNKESLPGSAMLVKILTKYPDLSADWLLTGRGEMLKTNGTSGALTPDTCQRSESKDTKNDSNKQDNKDIFLPDHPNTFPQFDQLITTITEQAEEIGRLKARIEELERRRGDDAGYAQNSNIANAG